MASVPKSGPPAAGFTRIRAGFVTGEDGDTPVEGVLITVSLAAGAINSDGVITDHGTYTATANSVGLIFDLDILQDTGSQLFDLRVFRTNILPQVPILTLKLYPGQDDTGERTFTLGRHIHQTYDFPVHDLLHRLSVYGKFQTVNKTPLAGVRVEMHLEQHEDWQHSFNFLAEGDYGIRNNWSIVLPHTFTAISDENGEVNFEDIPSTEFIRAPYRIKATSPDGIVLFDIVDVVSGYPNQRYVIGVGSKQPIPGQES